MEEEDERMSFQSIRKNKSLCRDFTRTIWEDGCKYSDECKKEGYICAPNSNLCTGVKMSPRPKVPPKGPPAKET